MIGQAILDILVKTLLPSIIHLVIIVFSALGWVYLWGRKIPILKTDLAKNIAATIVLLISACLLVWGWAYDFRLSGFEWPVWLQATIDVLVRFLISEVFYVVLAWRFFDRSDSFLDKFFGKDKGHKPIKKKRG